MTTPDTFKMIYLLFIIYSINFLRGSEEGARLRGEGIGVGVEGSGTCMCASTPLLSPFTLNCTNTIIDRS